MSMTHGLYTSGPQGSAIPLTREQKLAQALAYIRGETNWVQKRGLVAHRAAIERIRIILETVER